jgi:hypothetical protein
VATPTTFSQDQLREGEEEMKIAILGWGSLIWDSGDLHLASNWLEGGPILPIEFSRISDDGRLTLVIDEQHGVNVPACYAHSSLNDLDKAIADLQQRERTPRPDRIGFIDIAGDRASERARTKHPTSCERVQSWAASHKGFDAVVWTAIEPRFREKTGLPFSVGAAVDYLGGLREPRRTLALAYMRKAPPNVLTPVRQKVAAVLDPSVIPTQAASGSKV